MISFQAGNLNDVLSKLEQKASEGVFQINVTNNLENANFSQVIALRQGRIVYGGSQLVTPEAFAQRVAQKLDLTIINAALKTSADKIQDKTSFEELFSLLKRYRLLKPHQLESVLMQDVMQTLEQVLPFGGVINSLPELKFDLACEGLGWSELAIELAERKLEWRKLLPVITTARDVPHLTSEGLNKISSITVSQHCRQWVDGKKSLGEIAEATNQDTLKLAQDYYHWVKQGWITFGGDESVTDSFAIPAASLPESQVDRVELPMILSVDDSPVVQTMIKRAVGDRYKLLLAGNGMEALKVLNTYKNSVQLALLDVTMPDIDGLELCRTIRKIKYFENLPIIMLTAKDGMFDKFKGKFAGSTEYLTKPVDQQQLLATIGKYVFSLN